MKLVLTVAGLLLILGGCQLVAQAPSLQHCSEVQYMRSGADFIVIAKCQLPVGGLPAF